MDIKIIGTLLSGERGLEKQNFAYEKQIILNYKAEVSKGTIRLFGKEKCHLRVGKGNKSL